MMANRNINDVPLVSLEQIKNISFSSFKYNKYFNKICSLIPNKEFERLEIKNLTNNDKNLVYCFVIKDKILKIGSTSRSITDRISSYNCGKEAYRKKGTCSTTNYFVLQTLLNINEEIDVYAFFTEKIVIDVFGDLKEIKIPSKTYEKKILRDLKINDELPSFCQQT